MKKFFLEFFLGHTFVRSFYRTNGNPFMDFWGRILWGSRLKWAALLVLGGGVTCFGFQITQNKI